MVRRSILGFSICLAAAASCSGDEEPGGPEGQDASVTDASAGGAPARPGEAGTPSSAYSMTVDPGARQITFGRSGETLLEFPADGLQLGQVDGLDETTNYDPHGFVVAGASPPATLQWLDMQAVDGAEDGASATLDFGGGTTVRLEVTRAGDEPRWKLEMFPEAGAERIAYFRLRPRVDREEGFYGLGEYFDQVNHRGKIRTLQLELDPEVESATNDANVPVPLVTGTRGWGLFAQTRHPTTVDVAANEDDRIDLVVATAQDSPDGFVFHVFLADHPLDITRHYYEVTGYPAKPARWALGPLVWRDENRDQAEVESDLGIMRDEDLATTGIWIDRPYASGVNTFDFEPTQFPDPRAMIQLAQDLGFRVALWHTPYAGEQSGDPDTDALASEAAAGGYYPPESGLIFNNWGVPIDFTNSEATSWWQDLLGRYTALGIEGYKLDYAQDVTLGLPGLRTRWTFADGSDERTMHAGYAVIYHRTYAETLPDSGGFLLCRAGTWGGQQYASVIWPGDLDANFAKHRETMTDRDGQTYVAVGGLPASVVAGLSLGPSGYPLFGADTGGYRRSPPDEETFRRWFEQTALSTVMQIGTNTNEVAWEWEEYGWSAETLEDYRRYTRLHLRLWPYEWTFLERLYTDGRPIQRALGLAHPELGEHPNDVYLFGDALLVAPVVERGVTEREVPLPEGAWLDWWTGTGYQGGARATLPAPLGTLPLLVKKGALVPMLRPTIDTLAPTTHPDRVDSYDTTPGLLWVRTTPANAPSEFRVFDGTDLGQAPIEGGLELTAADGSEFDQGFVFEVFAFGDAAPSTVHDGDTSLTRAADLAALDSMDSGWTYAAQTGGTLWIKVAPGDRTVRVSE